MWQQTATPSPQAPAETPIVCDTTGVIQCSVSEKVSRNQSQDDIRLIARFVSLVSERNRRYFLTWREKLPSAAYEVVRRIHQFPYLPYGDMYAITDMHIVLEEDRNRITVRYLKHPEQSLEAERTEADYIVYDAPLAPFMKAIEKELGNLKKYEKLSDRR